MAARAPAAAVALRDATLVSLLAYAGPRPESEAIVLPWADVGDRTIRFVATKHGRGTRKPRDTKLLGPLAQDLREWRMASGRPPASSTLFPGVEPGDLWDTWRRSAFQPAARAVGLPAGARPRDLRSSFVSLLVYEGWNTAEVAANLGHSVATCERSYLRIFRNFSPSDRRPAEEIIREARAIVAGGDHAQEAV
jgi:integrase